MGFCLFNNVAVAAAALAGRGERVLVVDWDVHHGNGTQDIFWDDPRVLYVSTHQSPLYPGTGPPRRDRRARARGSHDQRAAPARRHRRHRRAALDEVVAPPVERFAPTWVLISAGYDAHRADPLADLAWTAGDYADLAGAGGRARAPGPAGSSRSSRAATTWSRSRSASASPPWR